MEVYAAADDTDGELDGDYDHLQDIQDILDHLDESDKTQIGNDLYLRRRYDLCGQCRERFLRDPMGRALPAQFDFSKN
jgi:hypothetical protein